MESSPEARRCRTLLQLLTAGVPWTDALRALSLPLDPAEALAGLTGRDVESLRAASREGGLEEMLRAGADWAPAVAPPPGTLAADLHAVYGELARRMGGGEPVEAAVLGAAGIPSSMELRKLLRGMAAAGLVADAMSRAPEFFPPAALLLIRRAEWAGRLEEAFLVLADGVAAGCYLPD